MPPTAKIVHLKTWHNKTCMQRQQVVKFQVKCLLDRRLDRESYGNTHQGLDQIVGDVSVELLCCLFSCLNLLDETLCLCWYNNVPASCSLRDACVHKGGMQS